MELLNVLKKMKGNNLLLWKGENYNLLRNYLEKNDIGQYYEPEGDYFEDVVMNFMMHLSLNDKSMTIVKVDDIMKYPLKKKISVDLIKMTKMRMLSFLTMDFTDILWITNIYTIESNLFQIVSESCEHSYLKCDEQIRCGYNMILRSRRILKFGERNEDKEIDVQLIKNPENMECEKWVLNKDFEEVE